MVSKRHKVSAVSKRKRRQSLKRSQVRISRKSIEVRRAVSQRGRTHPMEAPLPGMPEQPQAVLMESTAIRRFKYNIEKEVLRIWWVEGGVYDYYNVPESVVLDLSQAQSKGRFVYYNIRTTYNYARVR